jgi:hypothetical protein
MANGAPHFLHAKPIQPSACLSVGIFFHSLRRFRPSVQEADDFLDAREVIRQPRFHRWTHAERLMRASHVLLHEVYGHRRAAILQFSENALVSRDQSPHGHPHRDRQRRLPITSWRAKVERVSLTHNEAVRSRGQTMEHYWITDERIA